MITQPVACPHCHQTDHVAKAGFTDSGTQRAKCTDCKKTFALNPKSRALTAQKEALILRLLEERTTIRGICRAVQCGPHTVYAVLKKSRISASL